MANMSYCRFENTFNDLLDCYGCLLDHLSESEQKYRKRLLRLCKSILKEAEDAGLSDEE